MDFAEKIKSMRKSAKITQAQLSEMLGVPLRTIQGWEGKERTPTEYLQRLIIADIKNKTERGSI